jgi:predicted nucleic acid-binding protein
LARSQPTCALWSASVQTHDNYSDSIWQYRIVAAEHGLAAYDAAYVAAARHHDWTLVSADIADLVSKGLAVAPDAANYP